jgi:hypothetical protein
MDRLSVEVKLCRGDCSLVVSSDKFASPFTLAVEQTCASVEHHNYMTVAALEFACNENINPTVRCGHAEEAGDI